MKRSMIAVIGGVSAMAAFLCGCASTAEKLTEKANLGDTAAQWQLADLMMTGSQGAPCNPAESKRWLEKSIQGENVDALALKGEFEADGRYGQVPTETVLSHIYPAIKQNRSGRAGAQYLKAAIKANDVDHFPQCTEAIAAVFEGPVVYRGQTSLLLYGALRTWIKNALNMQGMRLAAQNARVAAVAKFIDVGWSYTHSQRRELEDFECDRVSVQMNGLKADVAAARALLDRTCEVEGRGMTAKDSLDDAKRKAVSILLGVRIKSEEKSENNELTTNGNTQTKDQMSSNIQAQYAGELEAFEIVEAPKLCANGDYQCICRAVAKMKKTPQAPKPVGRKKRRR